MRRPAARFLLALALVPAVARAVPLDALDPATDWHLRRLRFEGNAAVSNGDLTSAMVNRPRLRLAVWQPLPTLDPVSLRTDLEHLRRLYESRGYYDARVTADLTLPESGTAVDVVVSIAEGEPVRVTRVDVTLTGDPLSPADERGIRTDLPLEAGDVFTEERYERTAAVLRTFYRNLSYARVDVQRRARVDVEQHTVAVAYQVASGPPSVFGEVTFTGNTRTAEAVLRRELAFRGGEPFQESLLERTRTNLVALNLFRSVRIDEQPGDAVVALTITVVEAPQHEVRFGVGYDTEELVRGIAAWRDYDFLGGARQLGVTARASFLRRDIIADFIQPHWPTLGTRTRLLLLQQQDDEDAYTLTRSRAGPRLEWQPFRAITTFVFYRGEYDSLGNVNQAIRDSRKLSVLAPPNAWLSGLGLGFDWNETDDPIDPRKGWLASTIFEPVGGALGGDVSFVRGVSELRLYEPLGHRFFVASRARIGAAAPTDGSKDLPLYERFYAGGIGSIRGYDRYAVGPRVEDVLGYGGRDPIGGRSLIELSLEIRRALTKNLDLAIFADGGQVSRSTLTYPLDSLSYGSGIGVRYRTPVGPIRVDLAFPVAPRNGDPPFQVHVGVGQAF